jgi:hypothetical protein
VILERTMELIVRALAGVIAAWIPMDGGEDRRQSRENVRAKAFVERDLLGSRNVAIAKIAAETRAKRNGH